MGFGALFTGEKEMIGETDEERYVRLYGEHVAHRMKEIRKKWADRYLHKAIPLEKVCDKKEGKEENERRRRNIEI